MQTSKKTNISLTDSNCRTMESNSFIDTTYISSTGVSNIYTTFGFTRTTNDTATTTP
jgi:hypothetical protein